MCQTLAGVMAEGPLPFGLKPDIHPVEIPSSHLTSVPQVAVRATPEPCQAAGQR